ncbi:putative hydroxypyruvate isomerase isoform X2 [Phycodurus eques]|uniref:putative hydroxypyruvate isomerase isoform X2 n=1 Tax=Phycodurus eques TaxID=693459 RepID=UPI002ACE7E09|nr:putative hydroxypyruvate isomerase isoform X2 [Phycodurus eques]
MSSSSALRFCANISWLFTELPDFPQRMRAAAEAGFRAVEAAWPYDVDPLELRAAKELHDLDVVLINTPPGQETGDGKQKQHPLRLRHLHHRVLQVTSQRESWAWRRYPEEKKTSNEDSRRPSAMQQLSTAKGSTLWPAGFRRESTAAPRCRRWRPRSCATSPTLPSCSPRNDRPDRAHQHAADRRSLLSVLASPRRRHLEESGQGEHQTANGCFPLANYGRKPDAQHSAIFAAAGSRPGGSGPRQERAGQRRRDQLRLRLLHAGEAGLPRIRRLRVQAARKNAGRFGLAPRLPDTQEVTLHGQTMKAVASLLMLSRKMSYLRLHNWF